MQTGVRIHHMDNLRALAMLAGVVFHAALAHSPLMHRFWPTAESGRSIAVDLVAWFLHAFRMPLFFVVAGFFAALLVAHRGMAGLFRNRCARVLLPLLLFLPAILTSMHWLTIHAAANTAHPTPALAEIRAYIGAHGTLPFVPTWAHLWFLFYQMLFTVLVWVASTLELGRISDRIAALHPAVLSVAVPLLLAPALAYVGAPWPAPEFIIPSFWALVFFGVYFALGYQVFHRAALLDRLRSLSPHLLIGAVASYAVLFWLTDGLAANRAEPMRHFVHALLQTCTGFWMTLWCLIAAKQWLAGSSASMRWLSDASYWVYLVHLPVLFAIQYAMLDLPMHWTAKFAISISSTLMLSFVSYQWLVRHTAIGRLLNGKRPNIRRKEESAKLA